MGLISHAPPPQRGNLQGCEGLPQQRASARSDAQRPGLFPTVGIPLQSSPRPGAPPLINSPLAIRSLEDARIPRSPCPHPLPLLQALSASLERHQAQRVVVFCNKIEACRAVENHLRRHHGRPPPQQQQQGQGQQQWRGQGGQQEQRYRQGQEQGQAGWQGRQQGQQQEGVTGSKGKLQVSLSLLSGNVC
jgi:hypothetical protein